MQTPHSGSESTTLWMLPRSSALGQAWIPRASLLALPLPSPWMLRRLARLRWKSPTLTRQVSSAIHSFIFPGVTCVAFFLFTYSLLCSHTGDITLILQLSRQQHSSINYTKQNHFFNQNLFSNIFVCSFKTKHTCITICAHGYFNLIFIIIIKRISRGPIYHTRWEHRAFYINTNDKHRYMHTHTHAQMHARMHTRTHTHTHTGTRTRMQTRG